MAVEPQRGDLTRPRTRMEDFARSTRTVSWRGRRWSTGT